MPEHRGWAAGVAAGHDAGVQLSLRVEIGGDGAVEAGPQGHDGIESDGCPTRFRAVLQAHSLTDPSVVVDAAGLWSRGAPDGAFGPRGRADALLALRRAAAAWGGLGPLLSAAVPDAVDLAEEEIAELLGAPVLRALASAGIQVHWPRGLVRSLSTTGEVGGSAHGPSGAAPPSLLGPDVLLRFSWRFAIGDNPLSREELDRLAEAGRPVVRLRDQWVLVDPEQVRRAVDRRDRACPPPRRWAPHSPAAPRTPGNASSSRRRLARRAARPAGRPGPRRPRTGHRAPRPRGSPCATTGCAVSTGCTG